MSSTPVSEMATLWYGKCYKLEIPQNYTFKDWVSIGVITDRQLIVHILEEGQEVCLVYGYCREDHEIIPLESRFWTVIYLTARRKIQSSSVGSWELTHWSGGYAATNF